MNKLLKLVLLLIIILNFSCHVTNNEEAAKLYFDNEKVLNNIVKQMFEKKYYTYIAVEKKSLIEKTLSFNFSDEIIVRLNKIDDQYKTTSYDTITDNINFPYFAEQYFIKAKINYSSEDINILSEILQFMYNNDVTPISMKTPEYSDITVVTGFNGGLQYRREEAKPLDISKSYLIKDKWHYVTFK